MSLDLAPIRKRLAATAEHDLSAKPAVRGFGDGDAYSECGEHVLVWSAKEGTIPHLAEFIAAAPGDIAALIEEVERLRSEVAQLRVFRCHVCDSPMRLVEDGDADDDGYLYACARPGCHEECITSTPQMTHD
jgi:hypothetical protein